MNKKLLFSLLTAWSLMMSTPTMAEETTRPELTVLQSNKDFNHTVEDLTQAIQAKGMTIFAVINHQQAAEKAGLTMQPAKVIIYGSPKAGTPLMLKDPLFALSLPLKVLVTQLASGEVVVAHLSTEALIQGSKIQSSEVQNSLAKAEGLIAHVLDK